MSNLYYYKKSTEFQEELQLLSRFPIDEIRQNIRNNGWEYVSRATKVPIPVLTRLLIYNLEEIQKCRTIKRDIRIPRIS